jgi:hypothetical protein
MLAKTVLFYTAIFSAALSAPVHAADVPPTTLYVRCGKLMSSADEPLRGPLTMIVKGKTIAAIAESLPMPEGAREFDLSPYTCVPGFIGSHVHLWTGPYTPETTPSYGLQVLRAQKALEYRERRCLFCRRAGRPHGTQQRPRHAKPTLAAGLRILIDRYGRVRSVVCLSLGSDDFRLLRSARKSRNQIPYEGLSAPPNAHV